MASELELIMKVSHWLSADQSYGWVWSDWRVEMIGKLAVVWVVVSWSSSWGGVAIWVNSVVRLR